MRESQCENRQSCRHRKSTRKCLLFPVFPASRWKDQNGQTKECLARTVQRDTRFPSLPPDQGSKSLLRLEAGDIPAILSGAESDWIEPKLSEPYRWGKPLRGWSY